MAFYDTPGLLYGGAFYDEPATPPTPKKRMAKVKLSLQLISADDKVALGRLLVTSMTGNANFTTPSPTLASITTLSDDLESLLSAQDAAAAAAKAATAAANAKEAELSAALTALANWAEGHVMGDGDKLISGGFTLQGAGGPTLLTQVTGLEAKAGDDGGVILLFWDSQKAATGYEVQCSTDPNNAALWVHLGVFSKSSATITGQPTGTRCWYRVRAIGTDNKKGAWSNPADKVVP